MTNALDRIRILQPRTIDAVQAIVQDVMDADDIPWVEEEDP